VFVLPITVVFSPEFGFTGANPRWRKRLYFQRLPSVSRCFCVCAGLSIFGGCRKRFFFLSRTEIARLGTNVENGASSNYSFVTRVSRSDLVWRLNCRSCALALGRFGLIHLPIYGAATRPYARVLIFIMATSSADALIILDL